MNQALIQPYNQPTYPAINRLYFQLSIHPMNRQHLQLQTQLSNLHTHPLTLWNSFVRLIMDGQIRTEGKVHHVVVDR
eukprot:UN15661